MTSSACCVEHSLVSPLHASTLARECAARTTFVRAFPCSVWSASPPTIALSSAINVCRFLRAESETVAGVGDPTESSTAGATLEVDECDLYCAGRRERKSRRIRDRSGIRHDIRNNARAGIEQAGPVHPRQVDGRWYECGGRNLLFNRCRRRGDPARLPDDTRGRRGGILGAL